MEGLDWTRSLIATILEKYKKYLKNEILNLQERPEPVMVPVIQGKSRFNKILWKKQQYQERNLKAFLSHDMRQISDT